jgi:putative oxidoreductase
VLLLLRLPGIACRLVLAGVFLAAGYFKSLDPEGFGREIAQYGVLGDSLSQAAAYALIPFEVALGVALLLNWRPRLSHAVAGATLLLFIGAISFALATDRPLEGCGCFGRAVPRTPAQTLVEDALLLGAAVVGWLLRGGAPSPAAVRTRRVVEMRWKAAAVAGTAVLSGAFALASPHLPMDDRVTELRPGVAWDDLGVALAETDLTRGAWLVALLGLKDDASVAALEELNGLAAAGEPVIGLYGEDESAYSEFLFTRAPAFPLYNVSPGDMKRLHRRLPRFFAVSAGRVEATWSTPPTSAALHAALGPAGGES